MRLSAIYTLILFLVYGCGTKNSPTVTSSDVPFVWENANVYFLLTDRFHNGDTSNDFVHPEAAAPYRGFMGGDIKGITAKINEGYFDRLGITAIWMTPLIENIDGSVDEGTGLSYGFHGYWAKDWTKIDKRLGTEADVQEMVATAHKKGIRILMDAVINHTGPVTPQDIQWPKDWVRTTPKCTYKDYLTTTSCTLVDNLPDIRTESQNEVELPAHLVEKWKKEGRYDKEKSELDAFFTRTGYPKRPYYYIVKWLTDLIRKYGIDGFRVDTVKHTEEDVWTTLYEESEKAFADWKKSHPSEVLDDQKFFMVGEVYNYFIGNERDYDFGDRKVDFYKHGFHALINFDLKQQKSTPFSSVFSKYDSLLHGTLASKTVMNYISSHDDGSPYDKERNQTYESANKLLLTQGISQIYYGDEVGRSLSVVADGDAVLRSFMPWESLQSDTTKALLMHWQKLGTFRKNHISVGAGRHTEISKDVYSRSYSKGKINDQVIIALNQPMGQKTILTNQLFKEGTTLMDHYSGKSAIIKNGQVVIDSPFDIVLLEK